MKASETENWFETHFQQPKTGLQKPVCKKSSVNIPKLCVDRNRLIKALIYDYLMVWTDCLFTFY